MLYLLLVLATLNSSPSAEHKSWLTHRSRGT